jgi:antitoxin FitA
MLALLVLLAGLCYDLVMPTITIRNLDEKVKRGLQVRAALNGRSMEAEVRAFLSEAVEPGAESREPKEGLGTAIHKRFAALGGVDLEIPARHFSGRLGDGPDENSSNRTPKREGLGTAIHKLFAPLGGVELQIPTRRKSHRQAPSFE